MVLNVKLDNIIQGLEFQSDEHHSYLNKTTGEVITISDEEFHAVEENRPLENFPEWQHDAIKLAKEILETDNLIDLPGKFDINEYGIMERFCQTINDDTRKEEMYFSIKGRGAFRMFKHNIHKFGIVDDWYKFRDEALKQIAIEWCEENGILFLTKPD